MSGQKKQKGTVDRIEGGFVVVVTHAPNSDNEDNYVEVYVQKDKFKQLPKEGDPVTVEIE